MLIDSEEAVSMQRRVSAAPLGDGGVALTFSAPCRVVFRVFPPEMSETDRRRARSLPVCTRTHRERRRPWSPWKYWSTNQTLESWEEIRAHYSGGGVDPRRRPSARFADASAALATVYR